MLVAERLGCADSVGSEGLVVRGENTHVWRGKSKPTTQVKPLTTENGTALPSTETEICDESVVGSAANLGESRLKSNETAQLLLQAGIDLLGSSDAQSAFSKSRHWKSRLIV